ncbi:DUF3833 domain-containing protein [Gilvimarinus sp. SDUM040013]|uniref:DUF3833 domain-containing protein n=1 Tax=Gilvimarinus gilvus TaxID=3058038 RepID=A0ABU4RTQ6_9GAMM|nr:DUF3833 domain-containing protein [Gilvimarinus sp. SDUM040013]MDO3387062.1 DUF3833 domain-containing protein [Gilvimarinus sp. SDUM040013]MDX6848044.1 DUF3833 domain-containing protein [Gilvimarinus sp. SDUM040013]
MSAIRVAGLWLSTFLLSACAGPDIQSYAERTPSFTPETFFQGELLAHGVVKNRSGEAIRHFNATIDAQWRDGVGTLEERFEFDDGEIQYRTWTLTPNGANHFNATAGDVVGTGKGEHKGNALNLEYTLLIDYNGRDIAVNVDDWMWQVNDHVVINESTLSKWGFKVGSVQLVIQKLKD